jgi:hypothetical protein
MSKYEYYEQEGMQAVTRDGDGIVISVGNTKPVELTKEQFKVVQETPADFNKKFEVTKGEVKEKKKNVDKNE